MNPVSRRNLVKTAVAGLAMPALGRSAFAAQSLKVGFVYLGPIGDWGWTWAHEKGRKAMVEALKGQVVADYVENVKEDASATPFIKDLARQGHRLIFATTFHYMDETIEAAKQFPDVMFEHCTGYKLAPNLGAYNSRFHQGRAVEGAIAGLMSKSGVIGYLGSYKTPEVVLGVNAFTLAAQAVNPKVTTKLIMIDSWFDTAEEAAAVQTLANLGCDVVCQHTDSPAGLQVCEQRKVWCFGNAADMSRFAPKDATDRDRGHLGPLLHLARQGGARRDLEARRRLVGHEGGHGGHGALQQGDARQREGRRRRHYRRLEGRLLRRLHRSDLGPVRQGARGQGRADEGRRPRGDRLVRQGRAELNAPFPLPVVTGEAV
jgi:basic membrane lipoprotein Med (substrate-binding protein (PBP1-ABC) superfamily)